MKKADFKQLSREQLKKVKGGNQASAVLDNCGPMYGGLHCPQGMCCGQYGYCGYTEEFCNVYCQHEYGECW